MTTTFITEPKRDIPSPARHKGWCNLPGWSVQQRIINSGPLLATCLECDAVTIIGSTKGRSKVQAFRETGDRSDGSLSPSAQVSRFSHSTIEGKNQ